MLRESTLAWVKLLWGSWAPFELSSSESAVSVACHFSWDNAFVTFFCALNQQGNKTCLVLFLFSSYGHPGQHPQSRQNLFLEVFCSALPALFSSAAAFAFFPKLWRSDTGTVGLRMLRTTFWNYMHIPAFYFIYTYLLWLRNVERAVLCVYELLWSLVLYF